MKISAVELCPGEAVGIVTEDFLASVAEGPSFDAAVV